MGAVGGAVGVVGGAVGGAIETVSNLNIERQVQELPPLPQLPQLPQLPTLPNPFSPRIEIRRITDDNTDNEIEDYEDVETTESSVRTFCGQSESNLTLDLALESVQSLSIFSEIYLTANITEEDDQAASTVLAPGDDAFKKAGAEQIETWTTDEEEARQVQNRSYITDHNQELRINILVYQSLHSD